MLRAADALPDAMTMEAAGAHIGAITIKSNEIFNLDDAHENRPLFRAANHLHLRTREAVLRAQLLFASGDIYSQRLLEETERNLRGLNFLREPHVRVVGYHDGLVDVEVATHDVWTLQVGPTFSRSGGKNDSSLSVQDENFLGRGKTLSAGYSKGVDRSQTSLGWRDPNIFGSRWQDELFWSDNSDGRVRSAAVWRPFYALDVHHSYGLSLGDGSLVDTRYRLGTAYDSYLHTQHWMDAYIGWSGGLNAGHTRRLTLGWRVSRDDFSAAPLGATLAVIPLDRRLSYPYVRLDWIRDDFQTTRNLELIDRTEDLQFGLSGNLLLGASSTGLGSDRNATIVSGAASYGKQYSAQQLFFGTAISSRVEQGNIRDLRSLSTAAWYWRTSARTRMHVKLTQASGSELDLDHYYELGGDNGLRGYPQRYQMGTGLTLIKIEERLYTGLSLWHLFDIGAATFFDAGRIHGGNPVGTPNLGWLKDVGVGLRLGNTRSSLGNVIHIDLATPLNGESRLDRLQFLVGTEATF